MGTGRDATIVHPRRRELRRGRDDETRSCQENNITRSTLEEEGGGEAHDRTLAHARRGNRARGSTICELIGLASRTRRGFFPFLGLLRKECEEVARRRHLLRPRVRHGRRSERNADGTRRRGGRIGKLTSFLASASCCSLRFLQILLCARMS